jgi:hypothetical protein
LLLLSVVGQGFVRLSAYGRLGCLRLDNTGRTVLDVTIPKNIATKVIKKTFPASTIQEKQKMPGLQNKKLTTTTAPALSDQQIENVALLDELKSTKTALSDQRLEIADIQDNMKSIRAVNSEQHKMELAAIKQDRKLEMKALSVQHKMENSEYP